MAAEPHVKAILRQRRKMENLERDLLAARVEYRRLILEAVRAGHSQRELGRELDVSWQRIQELKREAEALERDASEGVSRIPRT